jgi:NAD-dependent deacetylase
MASILPRIENFNSQQRIVFLTGAGISAESGISTFPSPHGYWSKYDPMQLASPQGFKADPELVLDWYAARRAQINRSEPNQAHLTITKIQKLFDESLVITQNVDGLHQRAGNDPVLELHGSIHRQKCATFGKDLGEVTDDSVQARCDCGGRARPDVVWFGESLSHDILGAAIEKAEQADICFVIGTSSLVYPAAQLPRIVKRRGGKVIEINPEETQLSSLADISLRGMAGMILPKMHEEIYAKIHGRY